MRLHFFAIKKIIQRNPIPCNAGFKGHHLWNNNFIPVLRQEW